MTFPLTTLTRMKDRDAGMRSVVAASQDENSILAIIDAVSQAVAEYLRRTIQTQAMTEDFNVYPGCQVFLLSAYPVSSSPAATVANDVDRVFSTTLDSAFWYIDRARGVLYVDKTTLWAGPGVLRVTYTGGMGTTTAAFIAAFPAIADVVESEVSRTFRLRGPHVDLQNESGSSGSVSRFESSDLSGWARKRLAPYVKELGV